MIIPALNEELDSAGSFDEFLNTMSAKYGLNIKEETVSGTRMALLTRPPNPDSSCVIQDECSITTVTEDGEIVLKGMDRIYNYGTRYCNIGFDSDQEIGTERPVCIEEWLPGMQVAVSRYKLTYLLSTEEDFQARTPLPNNKNVQATRFVLDELGKLWPGKGIDLLFSNEWHEPFTWVFQIVPEKYGNNRLVLLSVTNMENYAELSRSQVDNLATYFNLKRPRKFNVYQESQIDDAIEVLLKQNPTINGVILTDVEKNRSKIPLKANSKLGLYANGSKKEILAIAECVMRDIELTDFPGAEIVDVLTSNGARLANEAEVLYKLNGYRRTRKRFAERVKHHPMAKVLYALRENKIEAVGELSKVLTPLEFVKMVGSVAGDQLFDAIHNYREKT